MTPNLEIVECGWVLPDREDKAGGAKPPMLVRAHVVACGPVIHSDGIPRTRAYIERAERSRSSCVRRARVAYLVVSSDDRGFDEEPDSVVVGCFRTLKAARVYAARNVAIRERWKARPWYAAWLEAEVAVRRAREEAEAAREEAEAASHPSPIQWGSLSLEQVLAFNVCLEGLISHPIGR